MTDKSTSNSFGECAPPPQQKQEKSRNGHFVKGPIYNCTDSLDFSILKDNQALSSHHTQQQQPYEHFQIENSDNQQPSSIQPASMRQSIDSSGFSSNTFLFKNFSKLTQRSQDNYTPVQSQKMSAAPGSNRSSFIGNNGAMRPSFTHLGARNTIGNRPRCSQPQKDTEFNGFYQKHLEDRVRNSSRMSLHMVQQAQQLNNETNLERFYTAQEISQEIISGRLSSNRHTVDPRMINGNADSSPSCFNIGQSKKIDFNPNSLGLNQLREIIIQQNQANQSRSQERKTLSSMLQEVHIQNRPVLSQAEEANLLKEFNNDFERLVPKNSIEKTAIDESLCLEGGYRSTYGQDQSEDLNTKIEHIFPQTISQNNPVSRTTARSPDSFDQYENVDMPRIQSKTCCTYVYDLVACILWPIGWLFYHLFCCFMCNKKKHMFSVPPHMLQKHLKKRKQSDDVKTMNAMIQLLKNKPKASKYLMDIRINPQLNKMVKKKSVGKKHSIKLRCDLEFYIPQIVSHFLRADLSPEDTKEMKEFFIKASQVNIFFAHRVWFNLRASLINKDDQMQVKRILNLLSELEAKLFSMNQEKLYIANSNPLLKLIQKTNLESLLDEECLKACVSEEQNSKAKRQTQNYILSLFMNKGTGANRDTFKGQSRDMNSLDRYNSLENQNESEVRLLKNNYESNNQSGDEEQGEPQDGRNTNKQVINMRNILQYFNFQFCPYKKQMNNLNVQLNQHETASFITKESQHSQMQQYFQRAFMSTPQFISDLTDISVRILKSDNKEKFLSDNLQKMNKSLPATTYVPILSSTFARNYMVLNIAYPESRLFITAEKAPFLICIEVFQPQELELHIQQVHAQEKPRAYEILQKLNLINIDQNKLVQKINYELSKPMYIINGNNRKLIMQKKGDSNRRRNEKADFYQNYEDDDDEEDDMMNDKFAINSPQNYNSHEGVVNAQKYPSSQESERDLQEAIEDRKSHNYQSFLADQQQQDSQNDSKDHLKVNLNDKSTPSDYETAQGFSVANSTYEANKLSPGHGASLERASVNDHYGFYQTPAKVIKENNIDYLQPGFDHENTSSYNTAPRVEAQNTDADQDGDDQRVANFLEYEKMQRSTVMSYYDQDMINESQRHTVQIDQTQRMGKRAANPPRVERNTVHAGRLMTYQNESLSHHDQNSNQEQETQSQGGQGQQKINETFVSASAFEEAHEDSEFTAAIPEFQSLEEKDIDKYFRELNDKIFTGESLVKQEERVRKNSAYGHFKTWKMLKVIVKSGDDLRSEQFAMQLIETIDMIFKKRKLKLKLQPYDILSTGVNCGIVEFISDAMSIDYIKKKMLEKTGRDMDLVDFYRIRFGNIKSTTYKNAINNLVDSLAAYSLVCYILQIKDRHNANILINQNDGSLVHIDFGFILASRLLNFETAPFKITGDIIRLLGGLEGKGFKRFRERMVEGYMALHEDNEKVLVLVKMLAQSQADLPCFKRGAEQAIAELCQRLTPLGPNVRLDKAQCTYEVDKIIGDAYRTWSTYVYDQYQYCCQGIL